MTSLNRWIYPLRWFTNLELVFKSHFLQIHFVVQLNWDTYRLLLIPFVVQLNWDPYRLLPIHFVVQLNWDTYRLLPKPFVVQLNWDTYHLFLISKVVQINWDNPPRAGVGGQLQAAQSLVEQLASQSEVMTLLWERSTNNRRQVTRQHHY